MPRLVDVAVFLIAGNAPLIAIWMLASIRGRGGTIQGSAALVCAAFGFGVAVIARTKGWV